jgi:thiol-disulfide isomerase/thioredoxin
MKNRRLRCRKILAFTLVGAGLLGVLALGACKRQDQNHSDRSTVLSNTPHTTYPMPPLGSAATEMGWAFLDADNSQSPAYKRAKISDYKGKVLVLDLYATWCLPCRESIPQLNRLQEQYGRQGLQVIGLNVGGPDDRIRVRAFASELEIRYPLGFPDRALADLFLSDDQSIPQTFVFDRKGQLVQRYIGYEKSMATDLERLVQSRLGDPTG